MFCGCWITTILTNTCSSITNGHVKKNLNVLFCIIYFYAFKNRKKWYMAPFSFNTTISTPLISHSPLTLTTLKIFLYKPWRPKGFFQFEIIINVSVSSFRFIWIPMLWVYGHYKYFNSYTAWIDFGRQNLTSTDVRFWRIKSIPALYDVWSYCSAMVENPLK